MDMFDYVSGNGSWFWDESGAVLHEEDRHDHYEESIAYMCKFTEQTGDVETLADFMHAIDRATNKTGEAA